MRASLLALVLGVAGCGAPTEVVLGIATDIPELNRIRIEVRRNGALFVTEDRLIDESGTAALPGSFTLYAESSAPEIEVDVIGYSPAAPDVRRRAVVTLTPGRAEFLRMGLVWDCTVIACGADYGCVEGACLDRSVAPGSLPLYREELIAGLACDSGTRFLRGNSGQVLTAKGSCAAGELCQEGVCYRAAPSGPGAAFAFRPPVVAPATVPIANFEAADLDGDGRPDLIAVGSDGVSIHALLARQDGSWSTVMTPYGAAPSTVQRLGALPIAAGNLDRDGRLDLLLVEIDDNRMGTGVVFFGGGDGSFRRGPTVALGETPNAVRIADLDGDGDADLTVANWFAGAIGIHLGNGDGSFSTQPSILVPVGPADVAVADLDADGALDLAVGIAGPPGSSPPMSLERVYTIAGRGDGTFASPVAHMAPLSPLRIVTSDIDGDQLLDIVTVASDGSVGVLQNQGGGAFSVPRALSLGGGLPLPTLIAEDLDGDGSPEIAVIHGTDGMLVLRGRSDGNLEPARLIGAAEPLGRAVARDFDGDGRVDLAVLSERQISVLFAKGAP